MLCIVVHARPASEASELNGCQQPVSSPDFEYVLRLIRIRFLKTQAALFEGNPAIMPDYQMVKDVDIQ
jgi:hypothetical protein